MAKKMVLGRGGLDALITIDEVKTEGSSSINEIELSKIQLIPVSPVIFSMKRHCRNWPLLYAR